MELCVVIGLLLQLRPAQLPPSTEREVVPTRGPSNICRLNRSSSARRPPSSCGRLLLHRPGGHGWCFDVRGCSDVVGSKDHNRSWVELRSCYHLDFLCTRELPACGYRLRDWAVPLRANSRLAVWFCAESSHKRWRPDCATNRS